MVKIATLRVGMRQVVTPHFLGVFNMARAQAPKKTTSIQAWFHRNLDDAPKVIYSNLKGALNRNA